MYNYGIIGIFICKGVYKRMFRCTLGEERLEAKDNTFDVLTINGCFSIPVKGEAFEV